MSFVLHDLIILSLSLSLSLPSSSIIIGSARARLRLGIEQIRTTKSHIIACNRMPQQVPGNEKRVSFTIFIDKSLRIKRITAAQCLTVLPEGVPRAQ